MYKIHSVLPYKLYIYIPYNTLCIKPEILNVLLLKIYKIGNKGTSSIILNVTKEEKKEEKKKKW